MELNRETFDRLFGFEIEAQEVFTRQGETYAPVKGKRALVRTDTGVALGVVSPSYGILQPRSAMALLDAAAGSGEVTYINGGSYDDGRRLYLQAQLTGASFDVAGQEHAPYLLLGSRNDGGGSYFIALTPTRLLCMNQLRVAIRNIIARFSIRHTRNAAERMELATEVVCRARGYFGAW